MKIVLYSKRREKMGKGNVLVIGNSGVGKSTLINAVLGEDCAEHGFGIKGTTKELSIYENQALPFRLIDSVGFEPSYRKCRQAIGSVKKWSRNCAKEGREDTQINVIWFCVDGTSAKLFPETIKNLTSATSMWPSVPIIVVITKSFSVPDREKNLKMVREAFAAQKRHANLRLIIPVVADTFVINENAYAPPEGITELIDATHELLPEGVQAAQTDIAAFKLKRKRALAHSIVSAATVGGAVVGAVPVPYPDAAILGPVEIGELNALAQIYGVNKDDKAKELLRSIVDVGTVSVAAKAAIDALKAIPGINIGASVLNALIAGSIVAAMGEGSIYVFEQIYLGKKEADDIDWVKNTIEARLSPQFIEKIKAAFSSITNGSDAKSIATVILELLSSE